jgi:hypothetical protein
MSHQATNWAISQRGLKPATKLVLWQLCDRHHPDNGCFPSQETLAHDCEMGRSTVNVHLGKLEEMGLIRRIQRTNKKQQRKISTLYLFPFDEGFEPEPKAPEQEKPCPETGHGAVSGKQQKPCPENRKSRVQNRDINPVREPLNNLAQSEADDGLSPIALFWIDRIEVSKTGRPAGVDAISKDVRRQIKGSGLLSQEQLKKAGLGD